MAVKAEIAYLNIMLLSVINYVQSKLYWKKVCTTNGQTPLSLHTSELFFNWGQKTNKKWTFLVVTRFARYKMGVLSVCVCIVRKCPSESWRKKMTSTLKLCIFLWISAWNLDKIVHDFATIFFILNQWRAL